MGQFLVKRADPIPTAVPTATSEGQWAPICIREYATPAATGMTAAPKAGLTRVTPVAKAAAAAEWPEGKEDPAYSGAHERNAGNCWGRGLKGKSAFSVPLAADATPSDTRPRVAARRGTPPLKAIAAATANQSRLLFALMESR